MAVAAAAIVAALLLPQSVAAATLQHRRRLDDSLAEVPLALPRGVDPASWDTTDSPYRAALSTGKFKCITSSITIDHRRVNDDYCDCPDGSDEPGTSACPNGRFTCAGGGEIPSAFVDDGVCDCCSGDDEAPGACAPKCSVPEVAQRTPAARTAPDRAASNLEPRAGGGVAARATPAATTASGPRTRRAAVPEKVVLPIEVAPLGRKGGGHAQEHTPGGVGEQRVRPVTAVAMIAIAALCVCCLAPRRYGRHVAGQRRAHHHGKARGAPWPLPQLSRAFAAVARGAGSWQGASLMRAQNVGEELKGA